MALVPRGPFGLGPAVQIVGSETLALQLSLQCLQLPLVLVLLHRAAMGLWWVLAGRGAAAWHKPLARTILPLG